MGRENVTSGGRALLCPSSRADQEGARVFGVAAGNAEEPEVAYLEESQPVAPALLALAEGLPPEQVFRIASPCAEGGCVHFRESRCSLGARIVSEAHEVADAPPPCSIRAHCRWFAEQNVAACRRCPQIVTRASIVVQRGDSVDERVRKRLRVL